MWGNLWTFFTIVNLASLYRNTLTKGIAMSHFYHDALKPVLNGHVESLVKFLRLKRMLKRTVMCPERCVNMVCKPYTRNKEGIAFTSYNKDCNGYIK